jgi:hypothetical protein
MFKTLSFGVKYTAKDKGVTRCVEIKKINIDNIIEIAGLEPTSDTITIKHIGESTDSFIVINKSRRTYPISEEIINVENFEEIKKEILEW